MNKLEFEIFTPTVCDIHIKDKLLKIATQTEMPLIQFITCC